MIDTAGGATALIALALWRAVRDSTTSKNSRKESGP
jgi:hypothetical protein